MTNKSIPIQQQRNDGRGGGRTRRNIKA